MTKTARAESGGEILTVELDFERHTWTSAADEPEGDFPFVAELDGKRYEIYSDGTFGEVEPDA